MTASTAITIRIYSDDGLSVDASMLANVVELKAVTLTFRQVRAA